MKNSELKDLINKIGLKKDKVSFSSIFNYYAPRVLGYLISTGSKREIAEEITQEVLSTVWLKSSQFDLNKGNVNTWIFTIARNKRIDRFRKNETPQYNTQDLINALYSQEKYEGSNMQDKIIEIQSNLNEKEKKMIKMSFFEGKTHKNIAKDLEIPLGTVKSRIRNTLLKIKNFK